MCNVQNKTGKQNIKRRKVRVRARNQASTHGHAPGHHIMATNFIALFFHEFALQQFTNPFLNDEDDEDYLPPASSRGGTVDDPIVIDDDDDHAMQFVGIRQVSFRDHRTGDIVDLTLDDNQHGQSSSSSSSSSSSAGVRVMSSVNTSSSSAWDIDYNAFASSVEEQHTASGSGNGASGLEAQTHGSRKRKAD